MKEGTTMKRMILLLMGVMCLIFGFASVSYAQDNETTKSMFLTQDLNKIPHDVFLGIYAYGTSEPTNEEQDNNVKEKYMKMKDDDFYKAIIKNLENVADQKDKGKDIVWNKDIVDLVSRLDLNLSNRIKMQINASCEKEKLEQNSNQRTLTYSPGNNRRIWTYYGHGVGGQNIFSFTCDIYWTWDANQITSVIPSTSGEALYMGWAYEGVNSNQAYFIRPDSYYKNVEGKFTQYILGQAVSYGYPYHDLVIQAGGGASHSQGENQH